MTCAVLASDKPLWHEVGLASKIFKWKEGVAKVCDTFFQNYISYEIYHKEEINASLILLKILMIIIFIIQVKYMPHPFLVNFVILILSIEVR